MGENMDMCETENKGGQKRGACHVVSWNGVLIYQRRVRFEGLRVTSNFDDFGDGEEDGLGLGLGLWMSERRYYVENQESGGTCNLYRTWQRRGAGKRKRLI
ncbi:MAG: hypothetical protein CMP47_03015 [Rickettsiales bacterium]|nr:hypothetical protein [Rickettsiales bacterium]